MWVGQTFARTDRKGFSLIMKGISILTLVAVLSLSLGCRGEAGTKAAENTVSVPTATPAKTSASLDNSILVAYFSCTGTTEQIAKWIAEQTGAYLYQIAPETPYTTADLNYRDPLSRVTAEKNNPSARPSISSTTGDMGNYDTVFLGYPIWWGQAPKIISTFLESYDFSGKTIVPFCTSSSSGVGSSDTNLHSLCASSVSWKQGKRFPAAASKKTVTEWVEGLGIQTGNTQNAGTSNFKTKTVLLNSDY